MHEEALCRVLLIKAVEETDRTGTLVPAADRAAAAREALRNAGDAASSDIAEATGTTLSAQAQGLLALRAESLQRQLVARFPFVEAVFALARGPAWAAWSIAALALVLGLSLSALDGSRRVNILAFPLLGLVLWNLLVYLLLALDWLRSLRGGHRRHWLAGLLAQSTLARLKRLIARSAPYNAPLAEALGGFLAEWSQAARPLLVARAVRLFHLSAMLVGVGLIAGLYLRGVALDYRAGWESTFLDAHQVRAMLGVIYGPASWLTGISVPAAEQLAAIRWDAGHGGESAASWIHLLAATTVLLVVLPRLLLVLIATATCWRRSRDAWLPPAVVPYFRSSFGAVGAGLRRGIVAVLPYAYEPTAATLATLRELLARALGDSLAVDVHAGVRYGDEEDFLRNLSDRGGAIADVIVLLFSLAATPEDENHGAVLAGVRDWLERARRQAQLLVLVDQGPYASRMLQAGAAQRVRERQELWDAFVDARGLTACFVDLGRTPGSDVEAAQRLRATLWVPAVGA